MNTLTRRIAAVTIGTLLAAGLGTSALAASAAPAAAGDPAASRVVVPPKSLAQFGRVDEVQLIKRPNGTVIVRFTFVGHHGPQRTWVIGPKTQVLKHGKRVPATALRRGDRAMAEGPIRSIEDRVVVADQVQIDPKQGPIPR